MKAVNDHLKFARNRLLRGRTTTIVGESPMSKAVDTARDQLDILIEHFAGNGSVVIEVSGGATEAGKSLDYGIVPSRIAAVASDRVTVVCFGKCCVSRSPKAPNTCRLQPDTERSSDGRYSTVRLFAKFRGWSTSVPLSTAT
jgi:hypothetical protein